MGDAWFVSGFLGREWVWGIGLRVQASGFRKRSACTRHPQLNLNLGMFPSYSQSVVGIIVPLTLIPIKDC